MMNKKFLILALATSLTGCSSIGVGGDDPQTVRRNFKQENAPQASNSRSNNNVRPKLVDTKPNQGILNKIQDDVTANANKSGQRNSPSVVVNGITLGKSKSPQSKSPKITFNANKSVQSKSPKITFNANKSVQSKSPKITFNANKSVQSKSPKVTFNANKSVQSKSPNRQSVSRTSSRNSDAITSSVDSRPLKQQAKQIQTALASGQYSTLAKNIHPVKGVQFSMYAFIDPRLDKKFTRNDLKQVAKNSSMKFTWGDREDTGAPLVLSLPEFLSQWTGIAQLTGVTGMENRSQSKSSMVNNVKDVFPRNEFVEYYQSGEQGAMRLIFEDFEGKRYLVCVVSDHG